jgi:hypothetical protein
MSSAFVRQLRSHRPPLELAPPGPNTISFRVQVLEQWDAIRVTASPETPIGELKEKLHARFNPDYPYSDEFVLKLHGWELLDENASIGQSGIVNGSIILLGDRRRRPVR